MSSSQPNSSNHFSLIKSLDFVSDKVYLEIHGNNRYHTKLGAFLSVCITVTSIVLAFMFGNDIYERQIPFLANYQQLVGSSRVYLKNFQVAFSLTNIDGGIINDPLRYLDVKILHENFSNKKLQSISNDSDSSLRYCNEQDLLVEWYQKLPTEEVDSISSQNDFICIKAGKNSYFENETQDIEHKAIVIGFSYCDRTQRDCPIDTEKVVKNTQITTHYVNTYTNGFNYTNPINYFFQSKSEILVPDEYKRLKMTVAKDEFISDNGWIIEDETTISYNNINSIQVDTFDFKRHDNDSLFSLVLSSSRLSSKTHRSYLKIADLFAKIGGIVYAMLSLVFIITYHYNKFSYKAEIMQYYKTHKSQFRDEIEKNKLKTHLDTIGRKAKINFNNVISEAENINSPRNRSNSQKESIVRFMPMHEANLLRNRAKSNSKRDTTVVKPFSETFKKKPTSSFAFKTSTMLQNLDLEDLDFEFEYTYSNMLLSYICCKKEDKIKYKKMYKRIHNMLDIMNIMKALY